MKVQDAGELKSPAYPTFFEQVILEGGRFAKRLEGFSQGRVEYDRSKVVDFRTRIMTDHADFIAHFLDSKERALIEKAMKTSEVWKVNRKIKLMMRRTALLILRRRHKPVLKVEKLTVSSIRFWQTMYYIRL
ncbi:MAG TPA: DUF2935 domain-containing protein [Pyrinomonadaceae bacterium]|nr:DUF2935 domain-containing protein [Pyrinomonadaceae bacterium]